MRLMLIRLLMAASVTVVGTSPNAFPRGTVYNDQVSRQLQTTDGTQSHMTGYTFLDNTSAHFRARVVARNDSNGDSKVWDVAASVKRHGGGGASIVGAVINLITPQGDTGAVLWSADVTVSGNDVRVSVTGAASTTVEWGSVWNVLSYDP